MTAVSKGAADVQTIFGNAEGSASVDEVVLGWTPTSTYTRRWPWTNWVGAWVS